MHISLAKARDWTGVSLLLVLVSAELIHHSVAKKQPRSRRFRSNLRKVSFLNCTQFVESPLSLSADGDFPRLVANGFNLTSHQCEKACVRMHPARYCVAANRNPETGSCLLSGYRLHRSRRHTHYRRICTAGRGCFQEIEKWQARFHTGFIKIPELVMSTGLIVRVADFCRRECEQLPYCIGFDVELKWDYCPYIEFRPMESLVYNMHRRHCS